MVVLCRGFFAPSVKIDLARTGSKSASGCRLGGICSADSSARLICVRFVDSSRAARSTKQWSTRSRSRLARPSILSFEYSLVSSQGLWGVR